MSKKLMVALALNNVVLGGALVLTNERLVALTEKVALNIVQVADTFQSFSGWSARIVDTINMLILTTGR